MSSVPPDGTPVTALLFDEPAAARDLAQWCGGDVAVREDGADPAVTILVPHPEGPRPAHLGDWIVRAPDGHFRPYSATAFAARFEPDPGPVPDPGPSRSTAP